jgi:hypothetical protein
MYEDDKSYQGPCLTAGDDERVTPLGKWLRDTKLNELPQLWNVLVGEMSLVGPRPEDPSLERTWPAPIAQEILSVRPGITSPASVVYRHEEGMLLAGDAMRKYLHELGPDKMRLDQLYVRYRSFWLDLDVILWTIILVAPRIRTYSPPEPLLFVGPVTRLIRRYVSWFILDFIVILAAITITGMVVRMFGPLDIGWANALRMALGFAMLYSMVGIIFNINKIDWIKASPWEATRLWLSWLVVTAGALGFHYLIGSWSLRFIGVNLGASILALAGIILIRYRSQLIISAAGRLIPRPNVGLARERIMIVGSGRTAEHITWLLEHPAYASKFQVVGVIDDDLFAQGMKVYGLKVLGRVEDLKRIAREQDVGVIILADSAASLRQYPEFRDVTGFSPARVVVAPDIFGSLANLGLDASAFQVTDDLDDFACQHCLVRCNGDEVKSQRAGSGSPRPVKRYPMNARRKWKNSGRVSPSL